MDDRTVTWIIAVGVILALSAFGARLFMIIKGEGMLKLKNRRACEKNNGSARMDYHLMQKMRILHGGTHIGPRRRVRRCLRPIGNAELP